MRDDLVQNIDNQQDNPVTPEIVNTKEKAQKTKDPKIIILAVLGSIMALLLIAAFVASAARGNKPSTKRSKTVTPTPPAPSTEIVTTPTPITSQIPEEFQSQFNEIEKETTNLKNLPPPQIDVQIGIDTQ